MTTKITVNVAARPVTVIIQDKTGKELSVHKLEANKCDVYFHIYDHMILTVKED